MGGRPTFSGTNYQAGVIAYTYAHVLAQARLGWFGLSDAVPIAVSGETGGAGDDVRLEFGIVSSAAEVQAKHTLSAGAEFDGVIVRIRDHSAQNDRSGVGIVFGRGSSRKFWEEIPRDIERLRSGRTDPIGADVTTLRQSFGDGLLVRLFLVPADLDRVEDPEAKNALQLLRAVLVDEAAAENAWAVLAADASELCSRALRRTRKDLVDLLNLKGIAVKAIARDERWLRELEFIRTLLDERQAVAAGVALTKLAANLQGIDVDPLVNYRLHRLLGTGLLQQGRYPEALVQAQRALDIDPNGSDALRTAAMAALYGGDLALATSYADRGIEAADQDPKAWGVKAQVQRAAGLAAPEVSAAVRAVPHYLTVLSEIAANDGDWARVLELTATVLAAGQRTPEALFFRASALLASANAQDPAVVRDRMSEVERYTTELLEAIHEGHPLIPRALALRASARRQLRRDAEADEDLAGARLLDPSDPEVIRLGATFRLAAGEEDVALQILSNRRVEEFALLLGMRAEIKARQGDTEGGRQDLAYAIQRLGESTPDDNTRFAVAEAAIELEELDTAEHLLDGLSNEAGSKAWSSLFRGRIAVRRGSFAEAEQLYRTAAESDRKGRVGILGELGIQLLRAGEAPHAVAAFEEAGPQDLESTPLRAYAQALLDTNNLLRAQRLIDELSKKGPLPTWALAVATNVALRQENPELAIRHLKALVEDGRPSPQARLALAKSLLDVDRLAETDEQLEALLADGAAAPLERMQVAELLELRGRSREAASVAFRAFRDAPQDPRMHRAFASIVIRGQVELPTPQRVEADTFVTLRSADGRTARHAIYNDGPVDPLRDEMTVSDARSAGLIGLAVGDRVADRGGSGLSAGLVVEEIIPALVHSFRDVIEHFADRFPTEPFFAIGFKVGEGDNLGDFAPLIASLGNRKKHVDAVFNLQRQQVLPLGFVAVQIGVSIEDIIEFAGSDPENLPPIVAEWSDGPGQAESIKIAATARRLVLTRSVVKTLTEIGLMQRLGSYELIAPISLLEQLKREVGKSEELVRTGRSTLVPGPAGFGIQEVPAGAQSLVDRSARLRAQLVALESLVHFEVRPLAFVTAPGSREDEVRNAIGHDSYDAVALCYELDAVLLADDLGLRKYVIGDRVRVSSASSISLIAALAAGDKISPHERDDALLSLTVARYDFIAPTVELLDLAVRRMPGLGRLRLDGALGLLRSPLLDATGAISLAAQVIKLNAVRPIRTMAIESLTEATLLSLSARWPRSLVARMVATRVESELFLLPQHLEAVRRVCRAFGGM